MGKYFRIGPMLSKDSVKSRMSHGRGDELYGVQLPTFARVRFFLFLRPHTSDAANGGSDQWGNITAGIDLIRKVHGKSSYGLTFPLMTSSDGQKFGKSEKGAIWLSPDLLSPFEFYQYLVRVADEDVTKLMRLLTFMDMEEIRRYEEQMKSPVMPLTRPKRGLPKRLPALCMARGA